MKRFERLDEAQAPDGTPLTLWRHGDTYIIRAGGADLMSTRRYHSEERLAEVACAPLQTTSGARALIGGLGFGFTLRAALRVLPEDATVLVAELVPAVIAWNRAEAYPLARTALEDPRVELRCVDVAEVLVEGRGSFDAIMLDVDNGADALVAGQNATLYRRQGVRHVVDALRPGGRVAYWLAEADTAFEARLRRAGLEVERMRARSHATSGPFHVLVVGQRPV